MTTRMGEREPKTGTVKGKAAAEAAGRVAAEESTGQGKHQDKLG